MVFQSPGAIAHLGICEQNHASFAPGTHDLVVTKRKCRGMRKRAGKLTVDASSMRLRAILNDNQTVLASKPHDSRHVTRSAVKVHRNNSFGSHSNVRFNSGWTN